MVVRYEKTSSITVQSGIPLKTIQHYVIEEVAMAIVERAHENICGTTLG